MARFKVFVTGHIPDSASKKLAAFAGMTMHEGELPVPDAQLAEHVKDSDAIVCLLGDKVNGPFLDQCPNVKLVANVAVGYDNVDVKEATSRGVLVNNTPGVLDNATADIAFGLLIDCARRISESDRFVRDNQWDGWKLDLMIGAEISGKILGILGMGRIGKAMARRAGGFGMKIIYVRGGEADADDKKIEKEFNARRVSMKELLSQSDFISIHCPLNAKTRHLVGAAELAAMKPTARVINTSRGPLIDQSALIEALASGKIAGAGLDVFEREPHVPDELKAISNVVLTPHIGSATTETRTAMAELAVTGLITAFSGTLPDNCVNKDAWPMFLKRLKTTKDAAFDPQYQT